MERFEEEALRRNILLLSERFKKEVVQACAEPDIALAYRQVDKAARRFERGVDSLKKCLHDIYARYCGDCKGQSISGKIDEVEKFLEEIGLGSQTGKGAIVKGIGICVGVVSGVMEARRATKRAKKEKVKK